MGILVKNQSDISRWATVTINIRGKTEDSSQMNLTGFLFKGPGDLSMSPGGVGDE